MLVSILVVASVGLLTSLTLAFLLVALIIGWRRQLYEDATAIIEGAARKQDDRLRHWMTAESGRKIAETVETMDEDELRDELKRYVDSQTAFVESNNIHPA